MQGLAGLCVGLIATVGAARTRTIVSVELEAATGVLCETKRSCFGSVELKHHLTPPRRPPRRPPPQRGAPARERQLALQPRIPASRAAIVSRLAGALALATEALAVGGTASIVGEVAAGGSCRRRRAAGGGRRRRRGDGGLGLEIGDELSSKTAGVLSGEPSPLSLLARRRRCRLQAAGGGGHVRLPRACRRLHGVTESIRLYRGAERRRAGSCASIEAKRGTSCAGAAGAAPKHAARGGRTSSRRRSPKILARPMAEPK